MANESKGYGPPKVVGLRAVRITAARRTLLAESDAAQVPRLRLEVHGEEEFALRAMPLMIRVGGRGFVASEVSGDGKTIFCLLDQIPEEGAIIEVGFPPHQWAELTERFSASMIEEAEPGEPEPGGGP